MGWGGGAGGCSGGWGGGQVFGWGGGGGRAARRGRRALVEAPGVQMVRSSVRLWPQTWGRKKALVVAGTRGTGRQQGRRQRGKCLITKFEVESLVHRACRWMVQEGGFPISKFAEGPLEYFIFAVRAQALQGPVAGCTSC